MCQIIAIDTTIENFKELKKLLNNYVNHLEKNSEYFYLEAIKHNLNVLIKKEKIQDKEILETYQKLQNIGLSKAMKGHFVI